MWPGRVGICSIVVCCNAKSKTNRPAVSGGSGTEEEGSRANINMSHNVHGLMVNRTVSLAHPNALL
jgi:hypothetical protein